MSGSASDARNAITNVLSSSYALTASYAISSSVEVKQEVSSSYAETSTSASYALTASYAISSSVEVKQEITSSYAETSSYAASTTVLSGSASDARNTIVTKISGSSTAPISALSSSASTSRDVIVTKISGSSTLPISNLSGSLTATDQAISASVAALSGSAAAAIGTISFGDITYKNSNVKSFNQMYLGNAIGGKFEPGEYQKIVTILPSGAAQNYQVVGRMTAQSGGQTHTINFNAALRSDTLPNLDWSVNYNENYVSTKFIKPLLWTKETATAGFIFAFECVTNIYGNVTIVYDVIPRLPIYYLT